MTPIGLPKDCQTGSFLPFPDPWTVPPPPVLICAPVQSYSLGWRRSSVGRAADS